MLCSALPCSALSAPPCASQLSPTEAPHVPKLLLLKSEALAAHLSAGGAASDAVGTASAVASGASPAGDAVESEQTPSLKLKPVVVHIMVAAFIAVCVARHLR